MKGNVDLTEDRTLKYSYYQIGRIASDIKNLEDKSLLKRILHAPEEFLDSSFDYSGSVSKTFSEICLEAARNFDTSINASARKLCMGWSSYALQCNANHKMTKIETKMLKKSIAFCKFIGYNVDECEIKVAENLGDNVLGRAYDGVIYLSTRVFMQGTKQVATTLLEEYLHIKYNLQDETYKMQTFLFDIIAGLGEEMMGEPL